MGGSIPGCSVSPPVSYTIMLGSIWLGFLFPLFLSNWMSGVTIGWEEEWGGVVKIVFGKGVGFKS